MHLNRLFLNVFCIFAFSVKETHSGSFIVLHV